MQQLAGGEVHRRGAPGAALVRVRDGGLLGRHANQAINIVMIAQGHGNAAHHATVAGGATGILLMDETAGFKRLFAAVDQRQRALGGDADAAPVHFHPFDPAARNVRCVEAVRLHQRFPQEQRHRRVIVVGGILGRGREIRHAVGKCLADSLRGAEVLRRHSQLIPRHESQQRAPGARDDLRVGPVHWATN